MTPMAADDPVALKSAIAGLTDTQALWAVDFVGRAAAAQHGQAPAVLTRQLRALPNFDAAAVPVISEGKVAGDEKQAGVIARFALTAGVEDPRPDVRRAVASAVGEALEPEVAKSMVAVMLIGGAVLLGLAVLGKLEITADGKIVLHKGLPGIKDAGAAVGALIKNALGGGAG